MATITEKTRRRGTVYIAQVRENGINTSKTFDTKRQAERWIKAMESGTRNITMRELITDYVNHHMADKAVHTQDVQRSQLAIWEEIIGQHEATSISSGDINRAKQKIISNRKISKATMNRYIQALSPVFTHAVELGYIDDNPCTGIKKYRESAGRVRYLQKDEITALLRECKRSGSRNLYPVVLTALLTGMRYGEIINLRATDIDFDNNIITIRKTKNGSTRFVPLLDSLRDVLKNHARGNGLLFPSEKTGKPAILRFSFIAALKRAGIADFRFHDLRHTAASYMAMGGENLPTIAEILGHKTLAMVQRYAHLNHEHKAKALEKLEKLQTNCKHLYDT